MALPITDKSVPNAMDEMLNVPVSMPYDESIDNKGAFFSRTYYETALLDEAFMTLAITVPSGYRIHVKNIQLYSSDGPMLFQFYPYASFTDGSTFLTPRNHLICPNAPTSLITLCTDATDLVLTGIVQDFYYGAGKHETAVFSPSAKYVIGGSYGGKHILRLKNESSNTALSQVILHWFEEQIS